MGAPGCALFCEKGHLYRWIEEHLYWDENLYADEERAEKEGCQCGAKLLLSVSHYGSINDCICLKQEIPEKGIKEEGEDEITVKIESAIDKEGNPIEAYAKRKLTRYFIPESVRDNSCYRV